MVEELKVCAPRECWIAVVQTSTPPAKPSFQSSKGVSSSSSNRRQ